METTLAKRGLPIAGTAGALGLSVGLSLDRAGSLTLDDFTLADIGAAGLAAAGSE